MEIMRIFTILVCGERLKPLQPVSMVAVAVVTHVHSDRVQEFLANWHERLKCINTVLYCGPALDSAVFVQWEKKAISVCQCLAEK